MNPVFVIASTVHCPPRIIVNKERTSAVQGSDRTTIDRWWTFLNGRCLVYTVIHSDCCTYTHEHNNKDAVHNIKCYKIQIEPKKEWREQNKAADEVKKSQEINDDHFLSTPFSGASAVLWMNRSELCIKPNNKRSNKICVYVYSTTKRIFFKATFKVFTVTAFIRLCTRRRRMHMVHVDGGAQRAAAPLDLLRPFGWPISAQPNEHLDHPQN